jgi:hypothetical protein
VAAAASSSWTVGAALHAASKGKNIRTRTFIGRSSSVRPIGALIWTHVRTRRQRTLPDAIALVHPLIDTSGASVAWLVSFFFELDPLS